MHALGPCVNINIDKSKQTKLYSRKHLMNLQMLYTNLQRLKIYINFIHVLTRSSSAMVTNILPIPKCTDIMRIDSTCFDHTHTHCTCIQHALLPHTGSSTLRLNIFSMLH